MNHTAFQKAAKKIVAKFSDIVWYYQDYKNHEWPHYKKRLLANKPICNIVIGCMVAGVLTVGSVRTAKKLIVQKLLTRPRVSQRSPFPNNRPHQG